MRRLLPRDGRIFRCLKHRSRPGDESLRSRIVQPKHHEDEKSGRLRPDDPGNPVPFVIVPEPSVSREPRRIRGHGFAFSDERIIDTAPVIAVAKLNPRRGSFNRFDRHVRLVKAVTPKS